MLHDDLNTFAYLPSWRQQLQVLANMALPEPWTFCAQSELDQPKQNGVLDRYLRSIFRKQALAHIHANDSVEADKAFVIRKNCAVLNTGLLTPNYKRIYMFFDKVNRPGVMQEHTLRGFVDDTNKALLGIEHLPEPPSFPAHYAAAQYIPEWPIRLSYDRLLGNEDSLARLPEWLRKVKVLPVYLQSCVEMARQDASQWAGVAAQQFCLGQVQYVLPLTVDQFDQPDLAVSLSIEDGFYVAHTLITLQMAYLSARIIARPTGRWLENLVV